MIVYPDRVVVPSIFGDSSYPIEIIEAVTIGFMGGVTLTFIDGAKTPWLPLKGKAESCKALIDEYVNAARAENGLSEKEVVGCNVLGGTTALSAGVKCMAAFGKSEIEFYTQDAPGLKVPVKEITELKLSGPGKIVTEGGFVGGGIGIEGASWGIATATLLNSLSRQTTVNTVFVVSWTGSELFLHTSLFSPEEGRVRLSRTFAAIQEAKDGKVNTPAIHTPSSVASQLEKLADLFSRGLLTDDEFIEAKKLVLERSN
jgi:hypothetical protein